MDDNGVLTDLQALGLSTLGSRVYLALLEQAEWVSGYEIAKNLGVARANVYDALRFLVRSGFAQSRTILNGDQYIAIPFKYVAVLKATDLEERIARLQRQLPQAQQQPMVLQARGWDAFREQVAMVLQDAKVGIQVGTSVEPVRHLKEMIGPKGESRVPIEFGCWQGCPLSTGCGVCHAPVKALAAWTVDPACLLVVDNHIAAGSWGSPTNPTVLVTDFPPIVAGWRALLTSAPA